MHRHPSDQRGLSLLELLAALAIAAILLGLGLPSFQSLMSNSRMSATANTLVYSLQSARSEAVKRSKPTGVCLSKNPLAANARCDGGGYGAGWIVYVDDNDNGTREDSDELVLQVEERSPAFSFTPDNAFATQVYFNDSGYSVDANADIPLSGKIVIVHAGDNQTREVGISANGRIGTVTP